MLALTATRAGSLGSWRWHAVVVAATLLGVAYTVASEWTHTSLRPVWQYSALMPIVPLGPVAIGLSPLLQWLILPPLGLYLARR